MAATNDLCRSFAEGLEEERGEGGDGEPGEPVSETGVKGTGAAGGKLGNEGELRGVELVHLGELVALVVVGGGEAVVGLAEQVEALLDGAEAGDFGVAGIDGGPVAGGAEDDVGVGGTGLGHERGKISVKADGAHQATVGRAELAESAVGGAGVCGFGSGG